LFSRLARYGEVASLPFQKRCGEFEWFIGEISKGDESPPAGSCYRVPVSFVGPNKWLETAKQTLFLGVQLGEFLRWATGLSSESGRPDAMVAADSKAMSGVRYRLQ
jgi:hypothetical protein